MVKVEASVRCKNEEYADCVERPAATAANATPPKTPIARVKANRSPRRARKVVPSWYVTNAARWDGAARSRRSWRRGVASTAASSSNAQHRERVAAPWAAPYYHLAARR